MFFNSRLICFLHGMRQRFKNNGKSFHVKRLIPTELCCELSAVYSEALLPWKIVIGLSLLVISLC
jgi:hypothetical protein